MLGYALFVLSLSVLLPYIVLAQAALSKAWGRGFSWSNLTLHNFTYLLFQHETAAPVGDQQLHLRRRRGLHRHDARPWRSPISSAAACCPAPAC